MKSSGGIVSFFFSMSIFIHSVASQYNISFHLYLQLVSTQKWDEEKKYALLRMTMVVEEKRGFVKEAFSWSTYYILL